MKSQLNNKYKFIQVKLNFFLIAVLFVIILSTGCGRKSEPVVLRFFCNETFWHVMLEEVKAFEQIYGIKTIMIPISPSQPIKMEMNPQGNEPTPPNSSQAHALWRNQRIFHEKQDFTNITLDPDILAKISDASERGQNDIYLTDSSLEIKQLGSLLLQSHEYPFCFLTVVMLVPTGNPKQVFSVRDVLEKKLRIGITVPSKDGLGQVSLDILSHAAVTNWMESIQQYDCQYDLLGGLETKQIDAALVWDATNLKTFLAIKYCTEYYEKYKTRFEEAKQQWNIPQIAGLIREMYENIFAEKLFAEKIPLANHSSAGVANGSDERRVKRISLISLTTSLSDLQVQRFADFLNSTQGQAILQKHGFVPKPY